MTDIYLLKIERIQPTTNAVMIAKEEGVQRPDESWFLRKVVRTFKVAAEDYQEVEALADDCLRCYLEVEGGIATWTLTKWFPGRD